MSSRSDDVYENTRERRPTAVLVVGMHRSGTSAVTRTLNLLGAALPGDLLLPDDTQNPTGFWESAGIVDSHDRFLAAIGSRWDDPLPLPASAFTTTAARACHDELVAILHRDLGTAPLFVIKDPRLCRLLPLWRSVLATFGARPLAVLPVRDPSAVAMSLHRRNGFSREKSLALWLIHSLLAEGATRSWPRVFVHYDGFIEAPIKAAQALAARLGCVSPADVERARPDIERFWSRDLCHHAGSVDAVLPLWVGRAHSWFASMAEGAAPVAEPTELDAITTALLPALEVYGALVGEGERGSDLAARVGALEKIIDGKNGELEDLRAQTLHLGHQAAEMAAANLRLAAERDRLNRDNATQKRELEEACRLRDERDALVAEAEQTTRAQAAELDRLRQENDRSAADVRRLHTENQSLAGLVEQRRGELDALAAEAERLRFLCAELEAKADVERSLTDLRGQNAAQAALLRELIRRRRAGRWWDWLWLWPRLRGSWFDRGHYLSHMPGADGSLLPLRLHYLLVGRRRDASPTPLFDPRYYRQRYADVATSGVDPLFHYFRHGAAEGRKPSPAFDSGFYLAQNADVARKNANPLRHYLNHGWREGRDPNPFFDTSSYLAAGDVRGEPLAHYLSVGAKEGRRPGPLFDGARYLAENPDVAAAGTNPLVHYLEHGMAEDRPRPEGDDLPAGNDRGCARILLVLHGLGGGVERHCADMASLLTEEGADVWRLESIADGSFRLHSRARGTDRGYLGEARLLADFHRLRFDLVHIHHFIGFGTRLWDWPAKLGVSYDVTIHDYALICPRVTLQDWNNRYCREPADTAVCDRCLAASGTHPHLQSVFNGVGGVQGWRALSAVVLAGARRVYVPDQDVADRLKAHFPTIAMAVRPHPEPLAPIPTRRPVGGERVRIAVIGSIGPYKGFDVLLACAHAARRDRLPLTFVVIGYVCAPERLAGLDTVEVTGRYREEDLPRLIGEARCHAAAFLSLGPETYMYTLSAALRAGLYPAVFDLGAPARRLKELGWGEILPLGLGPAEINRRLMEIAVDHPIPTSDLVVGYAYPSLLKDYFGLERREA